MVTKIIMNVKEEEVVLFDDDILGLLDIIEPPQQNDELIPKNKRLIPISTTTITITTTI